MLHLNRDGLGLRLLVEEKYKRKKLNTTDTR